jgi:hypothetical protein
MSSARHATTGLRIKKQDDRTRNRNVWVPNVTTPAFANGVRLIEFVSVATPTVTPIATAVALGKTGRAVLAHANEKRP